MKTFISLISLVCCITLTSCSDNRSEVSKVSVGKIKSAVVAPIQYNAKIWTDITTEGVSVCITSKEPVLIGVEAYIVKTANGRQWFTWDGANYKYPLNSW